MVIFDYEVIYFLLWCSALFQTSSSVWMCCMLKVDLHVRLHGLFLDPNADYSSKMLAQISWLWPHWANNLCIWNTVVLFSQHRSGSSCLFHDLLAEEENNCLSQRKTSPDREEIGTYSDYVLFLVMLCVTTSCFFLQADSAGTLHHLHSEVVCKSGDRKHFKRPSCSILGWSLWHPQDSFWLSLTFVCDMSQLKERWFESEFWKGFKMLPVGSWQDGSKDLGIKMWMIQLLGDGCH